MPILEVDGQMMAQTTAICNYLAREFGLYGKTSMESFQIDQVVCLVNDFIAATVKIMHEKDEAKKAELTKTYKEQECPKYLGFLENLLKKNETGYFVGSEATLADIFVYDVLWALHARDSCVLDNFSLLKEHKDKIGSLPQIKAYKKKDNNKDKEEKDDDNDDDDDDDDDDDEAFISHKNTNTTVVLVA
ncbi:glutathione S-transferase [Elysia marginata]|uniref:Glutathione S-transferase n=1 Tax=Elysia marginata TaxID=1093978 RepID=A0AAV4I9X5_9GAST|nr:glutathione S-transferase [Elysia marginata]